MTNNSFVTPDIILSNVLPSVGDEGMDFYSKGFYISQIQKCLQELAFDSFFDSPEPFIFPMPKETLRYQLPTGVFNVKQVYLFNGSKCDIDRSVIVYKKRNYFTNGTGSVVRNTGRHNDPFQNNRGLFNNDFRPNETTERRAEGQISHEHYQRHFYYNIQNGQIMFSSHCRNHENVMIMFNGIGGDIGEVPMIPTFFRNVVEDWVCETVLRMRMTKDKGLIGLWKIYNDRLFKPYDGSWEKAINRVKTMDSKEREDYFEYFQRGRW